MQSKTKQKKNNIPCHWHMYGNEMIGNSIELPQGYIHKHASS